MLTSIVLIILGFLAVLGGGEVLVRGAVHLAKMLGVSALLISLTIVALGTSAPEFAITLKSTTQGVPDMAVGNILGSCIFNVLFVLGLCAVIAPLKVRRRMLFFDLPMMIAGAVMLYVFATNDGVISCAEGGIMFGTLAVFLAGRVMLDRFVERRQTARMLQSNKGIAGESVVVYAQGEEAEKDRFTFMRLLTDLAFIAAGLGLLIGGAEALVDGSVSICKMFGVSELLIGLTVLAIGSSLPEIVVSVIATTKGENDVAVGNIVGSNTMNILCVLALTAVFSGTGVPVSADAQAYDLPIVLILSLACVPIFASSLFISRPEGVFFLTAYVAYSVFLYFKTVGSPMLDKIGLGMGIGLAVLLAAAMLIEKWLEWRGKEC